MRNKRISSRCLAFFLAILCVGTCLAPCASAAVEYTYSDLNVGTLPQGVQSVVTSDIVKDNGKEKALPWTYDAETGIYCSGNKGKGSSISVIKFTVKGSGALAFMYSVSTSYKESDPHPAGVITESVPDYFYYWSDDSIKPEKVNSAAVTDGKAKRDCGVSGWVSESMTVEAAENETRTFYFMFKKNGKVNGGDDCVKLKDIGFYTGNATVSPVASDVKCGTVSGGATVAAGTQVTLTAAPKADCSFYGWTLDGRLVCEDASYSFIATKDVSPMAIFGKTNEVAAKNCQTGLVYTDLAEALSAAKSGETVMLLNNCTLGVNAVIKSGVCLYVPYSNEFSYDGFKDGTTANKTSLAADAEAFRTVTVANGVTLTVNGKLLVGGVIGYPNANSYQGHTSGAHGKIVNNGSIVVADGAVFDCYGFVDGSGKVIAKDGAKVYEPFIVYDFSGGQNTLDLNNAKQSPFAQYTMQNIRCGLDINYGAALYGHCNLFASSKYNKTDAVIVGNGGLIDLKQNGVLHRTVNRSLTLKSYCSDLGKVTYSFDGGAKLNYLAMKVLGSPVSTEDILFPIPYGYSYIFNNGEYDLDTDTVLMPGASMTVAEDAQLNVNDRFFVLDGLKQPDMSGESYPSSDMLKASGFATNGVLVVNGTMAVKDNIPFGGVVQTEKKGARIVTSSSAVLSSEVTLGAKTTYSDNKVVFQLEARVLTNGALTKLEAGKTYCADPTATGTIAGYTSNGEGIITNQAVKGGFNVHTFDQKNTDAQYQKSAATCTAKAVYYYSCTCGEKGTATFESGDLAPHNYKNGKCTNCGLEEENHNDNQSFFSRILNAIKAFFKKIFFC